MNNQITTLNQAAAHLIEMDVVDMGTMKVEGKQLLEVCGYSTTTSQYIERQISKHGFVIDVDFEINIDVHSESRVKPRVYTFTLNAANHVLLAAMTEQGKSARQEAINIKTEAKPVSTGNLMLDALIESQRQISEVKDQVVEQQLKLDDLDSRTQIMPTKAANMYGITNIRIAMSQRHGLPAWVVTEVLHSMPYSPKPAGQVRQSHEAAMGGTYTVWYKVEVSKLFARFVSECSMVTSSFATHPHIEKRFKLNL